MVNCPQQETVKNRYNLQYASFPTVIGACGA